MDKADGLTIRECDKAVCKLVHNGELMVIFFKVDENWKLEWLRMFLMMLLDVKSDEFSINF